MFKKRFFGMLLLLVVIMLIFVFIGCDNGNGDNIDSNNDNSGNNEGSIDNDLVLPAGEAWIIGTSPNRSGFIFQSNGDYLSVAETSVDVFQISPLVSGTWTTIGNTLKTTPSISGNTNVPYTVSSTALKLLPGTANEVIYTRTNIGTSAGDGFTINGYTGSSGAVLYVSTISNVTDLVTLMTNENGYGIIYPNGKIIWTQPATGPNGTYTLYIVNGTTISKRTTSTVTITNGNGTVTYSEFEDI